MNEGLVYVEITRTRRFLFLTWPVDRRAQVQDWADLAAVSCVEPAKLERYGDEVLAIVAAG